jgi:hypothetical protein
LFNQKINVVTYLNNKRAVAVVVFGESDERERERDVAWLGAR